MGAGRRRGFTLVELVLAAVLLGIVLLILAEVGQFIRGQGMLRFTKGVLTRAEAGLAAYMTAEGRFPPDRFDPASVVPAGRGDSLTEGNKCLVLALGRGSAPFWRAPEFARVLADWDGDLNKIGRQPLYVLIDGWGRPLLYYHGCGADPQGDEPGRPLPPSEKLSESKRQQLSASLSDRWVHHNRRPLLDSAGQDGVFNDGDDARMGDADE